MIRRHFHFGEFELDESLFQLRRAGRPVAIQPKAFDLLLYLLLHRDRVVSRAELLEHLWPRVAVTDASLSKTVSWARAALEEEPDTARCIQTVRGRGFRFAAPVELRSDTADSPHHQHLVSDRDSTNPFVGREGVLSAIDEAVAAAAGGSQRLVLLAGEAGMGKTRTALEAAACNRHGLSFHAWCLELADAPDLWPWLEITRRILEREPALGAGELALGIAELAALVPALREILPALPAPTRTDPAESRFRLFEILAELFDRAARESPLLLVVDDFHWADRASQDFLHFLSRRLASAGITLLVAYREDELAEGHRLLDLARLPSAIALSLVGLDRDDTARLIELELGEAVEDDVAGAIHARTEGNPFFVKELARNLANTGQLANAAEAALPVAVRELLHHQLLRLSGAAQELLVIAALLGRDFELGELARIAETSPERAAELLDEAVRARLIRGDHTRFQHAHALVREALLERPTGVERARIHRRIAEALELHHAGNLEPQVARLARHFSEAAQSGCAQQAVAYAERAALHAAARLAWDEASVHFRRALDAEDFLDEVDLARRCRLLLGIGEARMASGQTRLGRDALLQASALAQREGWPETVARAALASGGQALSGGLALQDAELTRLLEEALRQLPETPSALRVRVLVRLSVALWWLGSTERCVELGREAVADARALDDPEALCHALYLQRWSLPGPNELSDRLATSEELLAQARRAERPELELAGHVSCFLDLVELGRIVDAECQLEAYTELAHRVRIPRYRWRALLYRSMCAQLAGRFQEAEEVALRALAEGRRIGAEDADSSFGGQIFTLRLEQGRCAELEPALKQMAARFPAVAAWRAALALVHAEMGREEQAREALDQLASSAASQIVRDTVWLPRIATLAELAALLEERSHARALYDTLAPYAARAVVIGGAISYLGSVDRHLGLLATTCQKWDVAERHFEAAHRFDARAGATPWLGWTAHDHAVVCARRGDPEQARSHLDRAVAIAASLGMRRLGDRAAALAATLEP